jgi:hypothetical protein
LPKPRRSMRLTPSCPPLTPDPFKPVPTAKDAVHEALGLSLLDAKREIAGRDKRIAVLEATVRELRTGLRFAQNAAKLNISSKDKA